MDAKEKQPERIEITLEDLRDDAPSARSRTPGRIEITEKDLSDARPAPTQPARPSAPVTKGAASFARSNTAAYAVCGAVGGLLAFLVTEAIWGNDRWPGGTLSDVVRGMAIWAGVLGAIVGSAIGSAEGVSTSVWRKAGIGAALGAAVGTAGGAAGGAVGQLVYSLLHGGYAPLGQQVLARTLGWCLVGLVIGLGWSLSTRSKQKIINGLLGGAAGGALGGLLFDALGVVFGGGTVSRLVAITLLGAGIGVGIGVVEELRKAAWLQVVQGPLRDKQFILYQAVTTVGSSPKCDITLLKDPAIAPHHCTVEARGGRYILRDAGSPHGTAVNGRRITSCNLRDRDQISLGSTVLEYREKAQRPA